MKISKKCEYAIKTLMELSCSSASGIRNLRDISAQTSVPIKFLEQIMMDLKRAGWVMSLRGKKGGYQLNVDAKTITLEMIMTWIDGKKVINAYAIKEQEPSRYCGMYDVLNEIRADYIQKLQNITLWDLCEKSKLIIEKSSSGSMYQI